jgi:phenylpyruvate tautomerase
MVSVNGSVVPMSLAASDEPATYGELVSIGGIGPDVNGMLSAALAKILETKPSVSRSRFYIKFGDVKVFVFLPLSHAVMQVFEFDHGLKNYLKSGRFS